MGKYVCSKFWKERFSNVTNVVVKLFNLKRQMFGGNNFCPLKQLKNHLCLACCFDVVSCRFGYSSCLPASIISNIVRQLYLSAFSSFWKFTNKSHLCSDENSLFNIKHKRIGSKIFCRLIPDIWQTIFMRFYKSIIHHRIIDAISEKH